ncbi:aldo/keto reductase NDAI_0H02960 [Naumovozyma dairenensis CBS 421]|uniref:NADP-dependent oxidoreductase domain-containing protein n=1 Tax=Naumovozyma dairenensis (strain ATCC 10597 / BCRC 20456 / CBS 421 / NBRC 0211 / NRRL Y-12639) TaxID=1071378 RepID=G0WFA8_NAUDC|nr:hypothetical protein NDAI_0H02960 [Naumovozyma dairenensis CBS 421]CCD26469.1 hypothetical protein NDAI_0H02960 [Naumovozyma dairenensis CBS 421]
MSKLVQQVQFGNTGIKVSPLIVGCMSYGSKTWAEWVEDDKEKVFQILKHCYDIGFRTFDTADVYSNGKSERLLGEFLRKFNIRRETVVILTKTNFPVDETLVLPIGDANRSENDTLDLVNQQGLSRKHILQSVKNSVERLGTYIDVLQIHRFDPNTPIKETMKALNDVVEKGDVRYIGASSMLPTQFVEMQGVADKYDWFQFVNVQSQYNLLYREDERDLMKYCKKHNIALTPWSPNYQGLLTRPVGVESVRSTKDKFINAWDLKKFDPAQKAIIDRVEELSKKKGVPMAAISTAWVLAKGCYPIVGMSSIKRVDEAKEALDVKFTEEELAYLEEPYKPRNFMY